MNSLRENYNAVVVGSSGGIGQALSVLGQDDWLFSRLIVEPAKMADEFGGGDFHRNGANLS
ncbi:hypothetical protein HQ945_19365 [Phyllobacterium sp. BT25]|uniref:Uncharacterized protein n=1 Tax=Phyllobacterium pellucidum TaxID=2740464 RepID=A0A849VXU5_9HYPH|nr:hypothetical protein [Phyllobacterium pellucidum]NTS33419.1 hypothetical protein [Phyllobacterium pellucidum]